MAFMLLALSTGESLSCSTPLIPLDRVMLLVTIMIANAKNTTDKRPIKYVILLANFSYKFCFVKLLGKFRK